MRRTMTYVFILGSCWHLCAADVSTVDSVLIAWSQRADLKTFDAQVAIKQLGKDGRWESDEPTFARFRFKSSPTEARFDILGLNGTSYILSSDGKLAEMNGGQLRGKTDLPHNARLRTNLWLGELPAFLLVGIDPEKMRYQFNIRSVPTAKSVTVYLYPQLNADQTRFDRLEVEIAKETMLPVQIHIIWKDGRHTFMAVTEPKTNVALEADTFTIR